MSKISNITIEKIRQICAENKYIAVRYRDNVVVGINCKLAFLKSKENIKNQYTPFYSWYAIDFQEYISTKVPYFKTPNPQ